VAKEELEMEPETVTNRPSDEPDSVASLDMLEPQTELGTRLIALAKEIDEAGIPKLTLDEIEEYLGRELGGIAEALGA
jgi:hypothetical protein